MTLVLCILMLLIPICYVSSGLVDKFQLHKGGHGADPLALLALGGVLALLAASPWLCWYMLTGKDIGSLKLWGLIFGNELIGLGYLLCYLLALRDDHPTHVLPYFQSIPVFGLLFAIPIVNEIPTLGMCAGIVLVTSGGILLSWDGKGFKWKIALLMLVSSMCYALYDVIFAHYGRQVGAPLGIMVGLICKGVWGLLLLCHPKIRHGFCCAVETQMKPQLLSELFCIIAWASTCVCFMYIAVAKVQSTLCIEPILILVMSWALSKWLPWHHTKCISTKLVISVLLLSVGGYLLYG